jgi:hypothetical protein
MDLRAKKVPIEGVTQTMETMESLTRLYNERALEEREKKGEKTNSLMGTKRGKKGRK